MLDGLSRNLRAKFPGLIIAGAQAERSARRPKRGRGGRPRDQGVWARASCWSARVPAPGEGVAAHLGRIDAAMIAVGAAFDSTPGLCPRPRSCSRTTASRWLFRLTHEP